ncbi:hypothetical protein B296_00032105 [Ensete ventricosum]|uniref:Uncharacterized protein n=1 Tax=Ensete ventricosum TaxID=4639 RepID=A0A426YXW0_ENSVE|nr:hypothetical protein B296_00032105 [Ensete ventricosum]
MLRPSVTREWVGEGELPKERTQSEMAEALRCENRIRVSSVIGWQKPCMGVAVCLSIDQGKLLREHRGVEAGGQKGRENDDESKGAQLPKNKASVRKEVDSEECYSAAEADLPIAKKGMQMQDNG